MRLRDYIASVLLFSFASGVAYLAFEDYRSKNFIKLGFDKGISSSIEKETVWNNKIMVKAGEEFVMKYHAADSDGIRTLTLSEDGDEVYERDLEGFKSNSRMMLLEGAGLGCHEFRLVATDTKGNKREAPGVVCVE